MQEYQDGTYGEIQESRRLFEKLLGDPAELEKTRAVHFGTEEQLEEMRRKQQSKRDNAKARRDL